MPQYVAPPPPSSSGLAGLVGGLVLIDVHEFRPQVQTQFGVKDEIQLTVRVIDHPNPTLTGQTMTTGIWNTVLIGQLRGLVGQTTLGRLVTGQARNGNNAPLRLDPPTEADQKLADQILAAPSLPAAGGPPGGPVQPVGGPGAVPPAGYPAGAPGAPYGAAPAPAGYPPAGPGWNPTQGQPPF